MDYKEWTEKEKRIRKRKDNVFVFIAKYLWRHYRIGLIGTLVGLPLLTLGLVLGENKTFAILGIIGLAILVISNYIEKVKHNDFARYSDDDEWAHFQIILHFHISHEMMNNYLVAGVLFFSKKELPCRF